MISFIHPNWFLTGKCFIKVSRQIKIRINFHKGKNNNNFTIFHSNPNSIYVHSRVTFVVTDNYRYCCRFYSLWDTGYAKIHIPIIASVSEHQPTTWFSFFFDLHILVTTFPVGLWYCIKEINDERVFGKFSFNCLRTIAH